MIAKVTDLDTMRQKWPLVELAGDQDIFATQMQFPDINDMEVVPLEVRTYPFTSVASQTVGWVGLVQERDSKLYADDPRARYTDKELCGHSGIEYVCEPLLRGRRGEETYTYDRTEVVGRTETQPGRDIRLTLDFDLQSKVEAMLDKGMAPTAAVIIDTASSDILALVSLPRFDLTELRQKYNEYLKQENNPLINRALDSTYPPGSVIKPIILIAAMEEHAIRSEDCISCPSHMVAAPNCWRMLEFGVGHDSQWPNNARNALKGSCNVYFSRLAERLSSEQIQKWLGKFGYGTDVLQDTCALPDANEAGSVRGFEQMAGTIYTGVAGQGTGAKVIADGERRFFGIGQGSLRVTPLQVANAMAAIARGGIYRAPHLILKAQNDAYDAQSLDISPHTLTVIRDGMHAVTSESGGTAYKVFGSARFGAAGVTVYGKTGSTQAPEHAWFAGFAQDDRGRSVAFSVIVEGGKHGADDAAPLAKRIVQYCIDAGYIGPNNPQVPVVR
jgi:penicillin-binding protein 2